VASGHGIHLVPDPLPASAEVGRAAKLVYLKFGGSIITDKRVQDSLRVANLMRLASEVAAAMQQEDSLRLLIGHGGGSFAHFPASRWQVRLGSKAGLSAAESLRGFAETRLAAGRLNQLVAEAFVTAGLPAVSFQPSASAVATDGQLTSLDRTPLLTSLALGCLPLVYGDAILDTVRDYTVISTEQLFFYLAQAEAALRPQRVILVGEVDGVFTADPLKDEGAALIERINGGNIDVVRGQLGGSYGVDVTGGMLTKIAEMYALCQQVAGLQVLLLNGNTPGLLQRALLGEPVRGTVIEG